MISSEVVLSLFRNNNIFSEIEIKHDNDKEIFVAKVKNNPYHDDTLKVLSIEKDCIILNSAYSIVIQKVLKNYIQKDDTISYFNNTLSTFVDGNSYFDHNLRKHFNLLLTMISNDICEEFVYEIKSIFNLFDYNSSNFKFKSVESCIDKCVGLIINRYVDSWINNNNLYISEDWFFKLYNSQIKSLSKGFNTILEKTIIYGYDNQIIDKIKTFINSEYLRSTDLQLRIKADNSNSIRITVENNPWRNGVVKGNAFFANINSSGKNPYINFKESFAYHFRKLGIECTANKKEHKNEFIRISLPVFIEHLNNPSDEFINLVNAVFLKNISFPEFGCCSKYAECEKAGKCLHIDQLYATACQYQKLLKRTGKFE